MISPQKRHEAAAPAGRAALTNHDDIKPKRSARGHESFIDRYMEKINTGISRNNDKKL
jgi:hypothetical protein